MKQNILFNIEQITDYLLGNLTASQKAILEAELIQNEALKEEVELMRNVLKGIEAKGDADFRQNLTQIEIGLEEESFFDTQNTDSQINIKKKINIFSMPIFHYAVAATLLGFGLIYWFFIQQNSSPNNIASTKSTENNSTQTQVENAILPIEKNIELPTEIPPISKPKATPPPEHFDVLTDQNVKAGVGKLAYLALAEANYTMPSFAGGRGEKELVEQLIDSAATHLRKKEFAKAIEVLENDIFNENDVTKSKTMRGHAFFGLKNYKASLALFQAVCDSKIMPYSEDSEYYLLLCYLTQYRNEKTKYETLKQKILQDTEHPAHEKVKILNM